MMKKLLTIFTCFLSFAIIQTAYATQGNSIQGYWKTIDDVSKQPKAIIQIIEQPNKTLAGVVVKIFKTPGVYENEFCQACSGDKHNKRILGMTILENLTPHKNKQNVWEQGKILDPKTGKIYNCKVKISESGQKLYVRGFIGLSLFGRSQTWLRVDKI